MKKRKKEIIIVVTMLAIGIIAIIIMKMSPKGNEVRVTYDGKEYGTYSLNSDTEIEINTDNGRNVLKIEGGKAFMIEASCPDKICMGMYPISKDSAGVIVCLPNKVIVEIKNQ